MTDGNLFLSPREVLERVSGALPTTVRERVIVVGSLAAGFHFFGEHAGMAVRTKDADCLLSPRLQTVAAGTALAEAKRLLDELLGKNPEHRESMRENVRLHREVLAAWDEHA